MTDTPADDTVSDESSTTGSSSEAPAGDDSNGHATSSPEPDSKASWKRRHWRKLAVTSIIVVPVLLFALWAAITLSYAFSTGERAGYAQKLSRRGWLCKTWEGELAMVNLPGAMPEIFRFSVRDDSIARLLERNLGKRVSLSYSQHRGVPSSCFGETEYYITNVRILEP